MVNPVNPGIQQAALNPFQKRIDEQVKNPGQDNGTRENNATAAQSSRSADNENAPVQVSSQARNDSNRQGSSGGQRGSLVDVTV